MSWFPTLQLLDGLGDGYLAQVTAANALKVDGSGVTQPVSGTFWQSVQPVSGTIAVSNFPSTQTVSGTVIANAGTNLNTSLLALESGGNLASILAKLNSSIAVTGTFWQTTQPVSLASAVTVQQSTASNLLAQVSNNGTFAVQATLNAETTKVIGTVNQGTSPWVIGQSTYANLLGQMKVTDGTNFQPTMDAAARAGYQLITDGTNTANVLAGDNNALMVSVGEKTAVYTLTGSQSANAVLASIDTLGYKSMSVHMTSIGAGISAAGVMQSGNNSNFVTFAAGMNDGSTGPSLSSSITNGAILSYPLNSRYIQISLTGTQTSGSTTIYVTLKAAPYTYPGGVMQGRFTNNSGAPGATNVGVLNAIANASAPSWTEGNQVLVSTDLSGNTRVILNAETTKVIGVVRNADGAGNLLTSNSTTYSSKFGLDMNLLGTLGTAFTTAGFVNVIGAAATGASVAQNPVYIASQATNAEITAVSSGQVAPQVSDLYGKQIISPYAGRDYFVSGVASATGTSDTSVLSSAGSGLRNYITDFSFANSGASTSVCEIKDGSGGTILWYAVAPAGGGSNKSFNVPIRGSAATGTYCTSLTSSTTVYFSLSGFKGA